MVEFVSLDFNKAFDTVPHNVLLEKISNFEMNRYIAYWMKNRLKGWA